jgi:hypothetical protein
MDIIRVIEDGVEFFTVNATGKSGTSISGAGRLNGVSQQAISKIIKSVGTSTIKSECLKPFMGKDVRVQLVFDKIGSHTQITWLDSDFVAALTEYYAFESPKKPPEAIFAYRKFAKMGIERWIQDITGWQPPIATPEAPKLPDFTIPREIIRILKNDTLTPTAYRLCLHLYDVGQLGDRPTIAKICKDLNITRTTYHKTTRHLAKLEVLPSWVTLDSRNYPERMVRDWLHGELGGEIEAPTIYGPMVYDRP